MESDEVWRHIDRERGYLADLLESLPAEDWERQSLCESWTIRDVGAHVSMAEARVRDVLWPAIRSGFSYNGTIKYSALRNRASHEEIVATIRGFASTHRLAPFISELEPLLDVTVHVQDICIPLGIEHDIPVEVGAVTASRLLSLRGPMRLWRAPSDRRLVATDVEWSYGDGPVVEAPMQDILLGLTGRRPLSSIGTSS
jgi:uncharacterized protein (TIGR03083 family)